MSEHAGTAQMAHCNKCGFEAPAGDSVWESVAHPPIGSITTCPECGSTQVHNTG